VRSLQEASWFCSLRRRSPRISSIESGRRPDAWQPPDWSRAGADGTFGNRFDDPHGYYRVLYAASQKLACFLETLARFRKDLSLLAELQQITGEDDFPPPGTVPKDWCASRVMGIASAYGSFADVYGAEWIAYFRRNLAQQCLQFGFRDLDAALLQRDSPRHITQLASLVVFGLVYAGIYYRSRYGHNLENWALFEPFHILNSKSEPIFRHDPDLLEALRILDLKLE
jgi:hypothetical protein